MNDLQRLLLPVEGYLDLGMLEDAWEELERLPPELRAHPAVFDFRIRIYHRMGKWEPARILAESLAKKCPENPHWWILWAYSLRREQSVSAAYAVLMDAASHHPNVALIPYNLACYSCVDGNVNAALALLKQAFSMDPGLKKTALEDPDLEAIFGGDSAKPGTGFDPLHLAN